MTSIPSATMWGSPTATKHALLLHGLTVSSHTWHRVATSLAAQGYLVTAPNLIGHGSRVAPDYRLSAIAEDLHPYLAARDYTLIIGHSLGGLTALALFSQLPPTRGIAFVLVDPPMDISPDRVQLNGRAFSDACTNVKPADVIRAENPLWTHEDGIYHELGSRLCAVDAVHAILEQNSPWYFLDYLHAAAEKWKVTVLIADPAIVQFCLVEDMARFPHVRPVVVPGAGHWIQFEFPEVIVDEALKTVAQLEDK